MNYEAFISFSSAYRDWVRVLHQNLERRLGLGTIFLDEADLGAGRPWVARLQHGLERARRVVLVSTPETFASPWVRNELETFQALYPMWRDQGLIQVALLVDTPVPPFLASVQHIDFRSHDEARYRHGVRRILGVIEGLSDPRNLPELPADLVVPPYPVPSLPPHLRADIIRLLTPVLSRRYARTAIARALELPPDALEYHASPSMAVSTALVMAPAGRSATAQAERLLAHVLDQELVRDDPDTTTELRALRHALAALPTDPPAAIAEATAPARLALPVRLVHPTGTVALDSQLYVRRESDALASEEMQRSPGMVHILAPRQMGKSSLLTRLAHEAGLSEGGPLVIQVNFQDLDLEALKELRSLLVQLTAVMLDAAGRDPQAALSIQRTPLSTKMACKRLVAREILQHQERGVLLALDEVDRVVQPGGCHQDFFAMLRGWHEAGKQDPTWARLRVALCFCTEAHLIPDGVAESPLSNVGLKCRLRDFRHAEVATLVEQHGLRQDDDLVRRLMEQLGGNPYLVRRALYALAAEGYDLDRLFQEALDARGPLSDHLERHLHHLQLRPRLAEAMGEVLRRGVCPRTELFRRLEGAGLVRRLAGTDVAPRYRIYRDFFRIHL